MFNSKYSNTLTIILIVVILAIVVLVGIFGYNYWKESKDEDEARLAADEIINRGNQSSVETLPSLDTTDETSESGDETPELVGEIESTSGGTSTSSSSTSSSKEYYKGFEKIGAIEIPATNVKYPILSKNAYSKTALETSICQLYGANPNEVGNMVLVGHNYRDSRFFSNNKKLSVGDKIYITDLSGKRVAYTIYNKYETTDTDAEYMTRDTEGKREISLSTCTDDGKYRLVIWASAD